MSKKKILVLDDEVHIKDMLGKAFSKAGYAVRLAESAEETLDILKDEKIQVIFMDLKLPGMNGVELCRKIRKESPITIIHAITAYASLFVLAECREAGFDDYFIKPVDLEVLFKAAQDAFEKIDRWKKR